MNNQSQALVAEYTYNGLGYRTGWHYDVDGDGTVEANTVSNTEDPWFQFVYDARWRITATYRASHYSTWTIDAADRAKEQFVYHCAGLHGSGGSSYIDAVILRDRDANTAWESQADQTPESRVYYCQNWRADVVALMTSAGALVNQVRYDPYGKPFGIAKTDLDADGDVDNADATLFATYHGAGTMPFADWNWDGTKDLSDQSAYTADKNADSGLGRGAPAYATWSHAGAANRKLYAGYEIDPIVTGSEGWESVYHVRHRVYLSQLGRWTRRDPLGYVDGMSLYAYGSDMMPVQIDALGLAKVAEVAIGGRGPYYCTATCNVAGSAPECQNRRVTGEGWGPSTASACTAAKKDANRYVPKGCYKRHCKCDCSWGGAFGPDRMWSTNVDTARALDLLKEVAQTACKWKDEFDYSNPSWDGGTPTFLECYNQFIENAGMCRQCAKIPDDRTACARCAYDQLKRCLLNDYDNPLGCGDSTN